MHMATRWSGTMALSTTMVASILITCGFEFAAVLCDEGFHRPCGGFAKRANCFTVDVIGDVPQQIHVFGTTVALLDAVEHLLHPQRAFAAGRALAARLVRVKLRDIKRALNDIDRVIKHNDAA